VFIFFLWVIWIWILIWVFIDIFRSHDLSGWAKALWFVFVLFIPLIGVLVYLIARGGSRVSGRQAGLSGSTRSSAVISSRHGELAGQHGGPGDREPRNSQGSRLEDHSRRSGKFPWRG